MFPNHSAEKLDWLQQIWMFSDVFRRSIYIVAEGICRSVDAPTPLGEHRVHRMMKNPVWSSPWTGRQVKPHALGPIGTRWIGFWYTCGNRTSLDANPPAFRPGACNEIGFHGTGSVKSIGTAASSGCVRMFCLVTNQRTEPWSRW